MDLKGLIVVVSGGASGLGEATCRHFIQHGAKAAIMDLDENRGSSLAEELGELVFFCKTDVTDPESVHSAIERVVERFGTVHVAVNCAGVGFPAKVLSKKGPIDMKLFDKVVRINLYGTMNMIRSAAGKMVENDPGEDGERGVVINVSSGAAFEGQIGQAAYSASKAAIVGMTLPIAREFADYGIRVVTIAPGLFDTPLLSGLPEKALEALCGMTLFPKRPGRPQEFAMLARQIVENPMINGRTIRFDGGATMLAK
jgi:NAD(P)-dependent dehydrogenase (short-subunit alcohol dehydrogenase family)